MNNSLIAVRYAKALYALSVDKDITDIIYKDIKEVERLFCESPDLFIFLTNPIYKPSQKKSIFRQLLKDQLQTSTLNFIDLLIDQEREKMIKDIIRDFCDFYRSGKNIKNVIFISATTLSDSFVEEIRNLLKKNYESEIELTIEIKPNLLGGFILMVDGKLMDASISSQIKQIKRRLVG